MTVPVSPKLPLELMAIVVENMNGKERLNARLVSKAFDFFVSSAEKKQAVASNLLAARAGKEAARLLRTYIKNESGRSGLEIRNRNVAAKLQELQPMMVLMQS